MRISLRKKKSLCPPGIQAPQSLKKRRRSVLYFFLLQLQWPLHNPLDKTTQLSVKCSTHCLQGRDRKGNCKMQGKDTIKKAFLLVSETSKKFSFRKKKGSYFPEKLKEICLHFSFYGRDCYAACQTQRQQQRQQRRCAGTEDLRRPLWLYLICIWADTST